MMLWAGLILGLLLFQALRHLDYSAPRPPMDLEAQEPATAAEFDSARQVSPGGIRVIDGDTFEHRGEKIRIADIDTPEVRGNCAEERSLAARATSRARELLRAGPFELHPIPGRDEDRYGRKLRIVVRNGQSIGDRLVAEGLARTWTGRREPWC
jgi:micrococcal nuclease